ncbi:MAG: acyl-CoA synthetase FdrA [Bacilli bacterium]|jgi:succinyl-CoA synthetase alpha subunit
MHQQTIVRKKSYFDSVTLMSLTAKIKGIEGVHEVVIAMATDMNLDILAQTGLLTEEARSATPNDLVIGLSLDEEKQMETVLAAIDQGLKPVGASGEAQQVRYASIAAATEQGEYNLAVISVPGRYAAREAMQALRRGLHVMLFSDNISIEEEIQLKTYARSKGLLVMGPDCGTAVLNNVGLCFANHNRPGSIGLVAASGTGLQEVLVVIDQLGGGVSQAIGVGGRDLSKEVGGIMMIEGIQALQQDPNTETIVLISKPPHPSVKAKIMATLEQSSKPVVLCFLDAEPDPEHPQYDYASELAEAAYLACARSGIPLPAPDDQKLQEAAAKTYRFAPSQQYLRGLFCGGTLTSEALSLARKVIPIQSNVAKKEHEKLHDVLHSSGHVVLDMGDDYFTNGKPHPMIEPSNRLERLLQEAADPTVKVILLDFEIGYGSHADPVGVTLPTLQKAQQLAFREGRELAFVAYVQGSEGDKQDKASQIRRLEEAGVLVGRTNAETVRMALHILTKGGAQ